MVSVVIAKSDRLLNDLLCEFIKARGLSIVGKTNNGTDTLSLLLENVPDLLIVGAELPGLNGLDLAAWMIEKELPTKIILFSKIKSRILMKTAIQYKVKGYLLFDDGIEELSYCLDSVLSGSSYMSPKAQQIAGYKYGDFPEKIKRENPVKKGITPTELRVLRCVSQHLSIKQIAQKLFVSPHTINNHMANIRQKLKLSGRGVLLKYSLSIQGSYLDNN